MTISIENMGFRYPKAKVDALSGISAEIGPGTHLLLGENGAGKTTLLHIIAGLLYPTRGKCMVDGCPTRLRLPSINSHMFFTGVGLEFPARTIDEMARIHAPFFPRFSAEMLAENLAAFRLTGSERLQDLSLGNRQKAKIAYALALQTDILLLDEPANGLDIESKRTMQQLMARCTRPDQTVIVSTHSVADLEHLYDGVIDLRAGRLLYALPVDTVLQRVRFAVADTLPADAIYSETRIGRSHCVLPNPAGAYSEPDYQLLYMAARTEPNASVMLSLLNPAECQDENH